MTRNHLEKLSAVMRRRNLVSANWRFTRLHGGWETLLAALDLAAGGGWWASCTYDTSGHCRLSRKPPSWLSWPMAPILSLNTATLKTWSLCQACRCCFP